jgi:hypothetical protein
LDAGGPAPLTIAVEQKVMRRSYFHWKHCYWGLAIGTGIGALIGFSVFDSRLASVGLTVGVALFSGFCSGRWGGEFWAGFLNP